MDNLPDEDWAVLVTAQMGGVERVRCSDGSTFWFYYYCNGKNVTRLIVKARLNNWTWNDRTQCLEPPDKPLGPWTGGTHT